MKYWPPVAGTSNPRMKYNAWTGSRWPPPSTPPAPPCDAPGPAPPKSVLLRPGPPRPLIAGQKDCFTCPATNRVPSR